MKRIAKLLLLAAFAASVAPAGDEPLDPSAAPRLGAIDDVEVDVGETVSFPVLVDTPETAPVTSLEITAGDPAATLEDGVFSFTPAAAGRYAFTLSAVNANGDATISFNVDASPVTPGLATECTFIVPAHGSTFVSVPFVKPDGSAFAFGETAFASQLPVGSMVRFWDAQNGAYFVGGERDASGWDSDVSNHVLAAGEAFWVQNTTGRDVAITVAGTPPSGDTLSISYRGNGALNLLSFPYPYPIKFVDTGLASQLPVGSIVRFWDAQNERYVESIRDASGWGPDVSNRVLAVGEGFFIQSTAANDTETWEVVLARSVTVVGGSTTNSTARAGEAVTVVADEPEPGKAFVQWAHCDGVDFGNASAAETSFTMPWNDVTVTAVFAEFQIDSIPDQEWTGSAVEPDVRAQLKDVDLALVPGETYTVSYTNNVDPGTATATVTMAPPRTGSKSVTFTILPPPEPPVVSNVVARQRWPWNGLVDVDYEVGGSTNLLADLTVQITFTASDGRIWVATNFLAGAEPSAEPGFHRATWNAPADGATNVVAESVTAIVELVR